MIGDVGTLGAFALWGLGLCLIGAGVLVAAAVAGSKGR